MMSWWACGQQSFCMCDADPQGVQSVWQKWKDWTLSSVLGESPCRRPNPLGGALLLLLLGHAEADLGNLLFLLSGSGEFFPGSHGRWSQWLLLVCCRVSIWIRNPDDIFTALLSRMWAGEPDQVLEPAVFSLAASLGEAWCVNVSTDMTTEGKNPCCWEGQAGRRREKS